MRLPPLNAHTVLRYLQDRRLLGTARPTRIRAIDFSRRNHNLAVEIDGRLVWFVKQIRYETPETIDTLRREARCYLAAQENASLSSLRCLLPRCEDFDAANSILTLAALDGLNAADAHLRVGPFDVRVAEIAGRLLGTLHRATPLVVQSSMSEIFPRELPWILRPSGSHARGGSRSLFLSFVESDTAISRALAEVRAGWQVDTVIHGDARLENFVYCRPPTEHMPLDARLVDWELADIGDAAWDCGSVAQHYWWQWISRSSAAPLLGSDLESGLTGFWAAYVSARNFSKDDAQRLLRRVTIFTGARLLQTAYEQFVASRSWTMVMQYSTSLARLLLVEPERSWEGLERYRHAV